jgi:hypothetical protein
MLMGALLLGLSLMFASPASSATEPFGPRICLPGSEAGKCDFPRGIATSPTTGNVFVADRRNNRINEFSAWGEFVKSWGWGVDDGSPELQVCTLQTGCQAGIEGAGVGQFMAPTGVAVDSEGNVYVSDPLASRVQKFSSEGEFLLMFGGGVDQGPNHPGNVCTAAFIAEGDACGAGTPGTGDGEFRPNWPFSSNMAIGPDDEVYVGDRGRVQEFDIGGNFVRVVPDPDQILRNGNAAEDKAVGSLAVDHSSGDLYVAYANGRPSFEPARPGVFRLDETTGELLDTLAVEKPTALAVTSVGHVFVFDQLRFSGSTNDPENHGTRILKFDSSGGLIEAIAETQIFANDEMEESDGIAVGSYCFAPGDPGLYVAVRNAPQASRNYVQAFGPNPDPSKCEPPDVPPEIDGQFAASVGTISASLKAEINTHYFTSTLGTTTYYVQWATAQCVAEGGWTAGCVQTQPSPPGAAIDSPPVDVAVTTEGVLLQGLAANTSYSYRFVTEREREADSDPPVWVVIGEGGQPGAAGKASTFTTLPSSVALPPCPNDAFRIGAGAGLRDCRAYELVSPLDKAGGDVQSRLNIVPYEARVDQASASGDALTFSAYRAFQNPQSAPFSSQYLTRRNPAAGWQTEAISPPQEGEAFISPLLAIDNLYRAFTADLEVAWLQTNTEPVLGPGGLPGQPNLYRRLNTGGTYGGCTTSPPEIPGGEVHGPQMQGFSANGDTGVFRTQAKLTEDASSKVRPVDSRPIYQIYTCAYEGGVAKLRLVSALPDGSASELENAAGGPANELFQYTQGRTESLQNAVSADGSKVFWTASDSIDAKDPGTIYLRLNPTAEPTASGQCESSEADKACTVRVSESVSGITPDVESRFWLAARDGSTAIFSVDDFTQGSEPTSPLDENLYAYDVASGTSALIAPKVKGILGASDDVSRIYFLSSAVLEGDATAGEPNLYLHERGVGTTYIGTLSPLDATAGQNVPSPGNPEPVWHTARVTPDGRAVAFMSNDSDLAEEVAGYDNTDQVGGTPAAEVYRYKIGESLACISCNRTGQRPLGRQIQNKTVSLSPTLYAAAMLPTWLNALYAPRVISSDGNRVFFESFESLTAADTNGKADVYQWEADGIGTCTDADFAYVPQSEGCVSLITSGKDANDSQFVDASPTGDDVFVRTAASLVSWDPGQIDLYDARVGGGFPPPPVQGAECKGEGCLPPMTPAQEDPTPGSAVRGQGNVRESNRCPKGKRKIKVRGKVRCVKKKSGKRKKSNRAKKTRRAAR